jgi:hypothetical protein
VGRRSLVFSLLQLGGGVLVWLNGLGRWLLLQVFPGLNALLLLRQLPGLIPFVLPVSAGSESTALPFHLPPLEVEDR